MSRFKGHLDAKQVPWIVKCGVGAAMVSTSIIVSLIAYRLTCPAIYLPFAHLRELAAGGGMAFLLAFVAFVCGFSCSVVAAGLSGTLAALGLSLLYLWILDWIQHDLLHRQPNALFWVTVPPIGLLASLVVARRLTSPLPQRVRRFAVVSLSAATLLSVITNLPREQRRTWNNDYRSPNRQFVLRAEYPKGLSGGLVCIKLLRIALNQEQVLETGRRISPIGWSPDSRYFLYLWETREQVLKFIDKKTGDRYSTNSLEKFLDTSTGTVRTFTQRSAPWERDLERDASTDWPQGHWSPGGKRLARGEGFGLFVYDISSRGWWNFPAKLGRQAWWISPHEVATYLDSDGTIAAINVETGARRVLTSVNSKGGT